MENFSVEEINLLCIYSTESRPALLADLHMALPDIYEPDMQSIFASVIGKLETMTDAEYMDAQPYLIAADDAIDEGA